MSQLIDLGDSHAIEIAVWDPDLDLNPSAVKYKDQLPLKCSGIMHHMLPGGQKCEGAITFDSPIAREVFNGPFWTVHSWEPLTLTPSLLCHCGDHGFITNGKWVRA